MKKRAILATRLEDGLTDLAYTLLNAGHELITDNHAGRIIAMAGLPVTPVEFATRQSKITLGRTASLHYSLHAGIAVDTADAKQVSALAAASMTRVDVVVAQLPQAVSDFGEHPEATLFRSDWPATAALLQSAIARFDRVVTLCDPATFADAKDAFGDSEEAVATRKKLAITALKHLGGYQAALLEAIAGPQGWDAKGDAKGTANDADLADGSAPEAADLVLPAGGWGMTLAPDDTAVTPAGWRRFQDTGGAVALTGRFDRLHGDDPDARALLDLDLALGVLSELSDAPSAAVAVRGHVCSVASAPESSLRAVLRAIGADPIAARGGVLAFNGRVDATLAKALLEFPHAKGLRIIAAEAFDDAAAVSLGSEVDRTLIELPRAGHGAVKAFLRPTRYGVLLEGRERNVPDLAQAKVAGAIAAPAALMGAADLAFRVARHCASSAVVIADAHGTLGICAGQAHTTDAVQIAALKARRANRACAAVATQGLETPAAIAALAKAKVGLLVLPAESITPAVVEAADGVSMSLLAVTEGWRTLR